MSDVPAPVTDTAATTAHAVGDVVVISPAFYAANSHKLKFIKRAGGDVVAKVTASLIVPAQDSKPAPRTRKGRK